MSTIFPSPPTPFFLSPPRFTNLRFRSHFRDYFAFPFTSLRIAFKCLFFSTKFHARSARKRAPAVASRRASLYHTLRSIHARRTPAEIAKSWIGGECRSFSRAESIHPTGRLSGSRLSISRRDYASYRIAFDPSCSTIRCERPGGEERSAALRVTTVLRILQNRNDETSLLSSTIELRKSLNFRNTNDRPPPFVDPFFLSFAFNFFSLSFLTFFLRF